MNKVWPTSRIPPLRYFHHTLGIQHQCWRVLLLQSRGWHELRRVNGVRLENFQRTKCSHSLDAVRLLVLSEGQRRWSQVLVPTGWWRLFSRRSSCSLGYFTESNDENWSSYLFNLANTLLQLSKNMAIFFKLIIAGGLPTMFTQSRMVVITTLLSSLMHQQFLVRLKSKLKDLVDVPLLSLFLMKTATPRFGITFITFIKTKFRDPLHCQMMTDSGWTFSRT